MILWIPLAVLATCALLGWLLPLKGRAALLLALPPAVLAVWLGLTTTDLASGAGIAQSFPWFAELGASFDLRLDGWSGFMATLVCGIGALVMVYAHGHMGANPRWGYFVLLLLGFMTAMLGLVLSDNLILLFVFWELTSIISFLLIGFEASRASTRAKALQALLVTGGAGLALLAGLVLLGLTAGTWRISELVTLGEVVRAADSYPWIVALVLTGALAKSAQVPLHFWLPNAMAAPTPVSAFLHSATMVKAGIFLLAVLNPVLGGTPVWQVPLISLGGLTLLTGAVLGIVQTDLKRILAYTTVAVLGGLTLLLGIGTELAIKSMVVFLLGHALYKAALFMVAGAVDHSTGTRDITQLGNLGRVMPWTALAAMLAAFSKAGFPPFLGFLGKEYTYKTGTSLDLLAPVFVVVVLVGNMLLFALALKVGWAPFRSGRMTHLPPASAHEVNVRMWAPPLLLAVVGLAAGLASSWVSAVWTEPAASAVAGVTVTTSLKLWHGFNVPLLLSAITVVGGFMLYRNRRLMWRQRVRVEDMPGPLNAYETAIKRVVGVARQVTRSVQAGALSHYVFVVLVATAALLWWKFFRFAGWPALHESVGTWAWSPALASLLIAAGGLVAALARTRLRVLLGLGVVGTAIAWLFAYYSAPDLALTQLLVEALTVVLMVIMLRRLPLRRETFSRVRRWRDASVSLAIGGGFALLVLSGIQVQLAETISGQLAAWSYPEAFGRNVVNVILVDFRALDTFGEIIVLAIAGLGVHALLRRKADGEGGAS